MCVCVAGRGIPVRSDVTVGHYHCCFSALFSETQGFFQTGSGDPQSPSEFHLCYHTRTTTAWFLRMQSEVLILTHEVI